MAKKRKLSKRWAGSTQEERSAAMSRLGKLRQRSMTPEQRRDMANKLVERRKILATQ